MYKSPRVQTLGALDKYQFSFCVPTAPAWAAQWLTGSGLKHIASGPTAVKAAARDRCTFPLL